MAAEQRLQFISWEPSVTEKDTYLATFKIGMGRDSIYEVIFYRPYDAQFYTMYSKPNSAETCAAWFKKHSWYRERLVHSLISPFFFLFLIDSARSIIHKDRC